MTERPLSEIEHHICEGAARIDAALCSWLLDVAEFDRREGYAAWECRSMAQFLSWRCGISLRTARDHVRVGHALEQYATLRAAFGDGSLSYSKVRAITRIVTAQTEATLVEWAMCSTAAEMDKVATKRCSVQTRERPGRYVGWRHDDDGAFLLTAKLSPEEGALVLAALRSAREALATEAENGSAEPFSERDLRPTNADALVAMAETTLAHGPTPVAGGDRHMVLVHVDAGSGDATLDSGQVLEPEAASMIRCDAGYATVVLGQNGEPLAMGRKTREPTIAQRRALNVRDGGCRFPGCQQRLFVDAHHVTYWENGGTTDLDNLVLLCRVHHRAIHHRGYRVEHGPRQSFRFYRPDGLELILAPPAASARGELPAQGPTGTPITAETPLPNWDGHHPDYATAIEGLMWLEENGHKLETACPV